MKCMEVIQPAACCMTYPGSHLLQVQNLRKEKIDGQEAQLSCSVQTECISVQQMDPNLVAIGAY